MPRQTRQGRSLKRVLEWVLNRDVLDIEIAAALGKPAATFSRRHRAPDFPTWEELEQIGEHFAINPRWLQVEFGFLEVAEVDEHGRLRMQPPITPVKKEIGQAGIAGLPVRDDRPPLAAPPC